MAPFILAYQSIIKDPVVVVAHKIKCHLQSTLTSCLDHYMVCEANGI